jgi:hypothetical protein
VEGEWSGPEGVTLSRYRYIFGTATWSHSITSDICADQICVLRSMETSRMYPDVGGEIISRRRCHLDRLYMLLRTSCRCLASLFYMGPDRYRTLRIERLYMSGHLELRRAAPECHLPHYNLRHEAWLRCSYQTHHCRVPKQQTFDDATETSSIVQ